MNQTDISIRKALENLVGEIKKGKCVLFMGAGVHAPPPNDSKILHPEGQRVPLGGDLAERLVCSCGFDEQFPDESPRNLQRVSLCFETTLGRKELVDELETHLIEGKEPSPALEMLAALPFKIIVTTNYDQLLEAALQKHGKTPQLYVYDPSTDKPTADMTDDPTDTKPLVFKMHGDLTRRESIVITDEDYIKFIQRMSDKETKHPVPQTVRYRMKMWPTLFVGYSLSDYNLRLLFLTLRWRVDPVEYAKSFSVDSDPDPLILKVWQDKRGFVTFVTKDLWSFAPWVYKEVIGEEFD